MTLLYRICSYFYERKLVNHLVILSILQEAALDLGQFKDKFADPSGRAV
jgi:hypothetical protein